MVEENINSWVVSDLHTCANKQTHVHINTKKCKISLKIPKNPFLGIDCDSIYCIIKAKHSAGFGKMEFCLPAGI